MSNDELESALRITHGNVMELKKHVEILKRANMIHNLLNIMSLALVLNLYITWG